MKTKSNTRIRKEKIKEFKTIDLSEHVEVTVSHLSRMTDNDFTVLHDVRLRNPISSGKYLHLGDLIIRNYMIAFDNNDIYGRKLKDLFKKSFRKSITEHNRPTMYVWFRHLSHVFNAIQGVSAVTDSVHYKENLTKLTPDYNYEAPKYLEFPV